MSLVAILDADKEGFLRSETSLIQTVGRVARNAEGKVILYADTMTRSMKNAIAETARRRQKQQKYNEENGITPKTILKEVRDVIEIAAKDGKKTKKKLTGDELQRRIAELTSAMKEAAKALDFEQAAYLRDEIVRLSARPIETKDKKEKK